MIFNLVSGPRNVSTALMYSFAQRNDIQVVDEPFYACYLSKTDVDHPGSELVLNSQSNDETTVIRELFNQQADQSHLFIKNMAHHMEQVETDFLSYCTNIFLIRDPAEMILSFIKKIPEPTLQDTAYQCQYQQFEHATTTLNQTPIVIDSAELLQKPAAVLKIVCEQLCIPFDEQMLSWEAGPISRDGVWAPFWYNTVHKSTGFKSYEPKTESVPERLHSLLETCRNYYQPLYEHAIKAPVE